MLTKRMKALQVVMVRELSPQLPQQVMPMKTSQVTPAAACNAIT